MIRKNTSSEDIYNKAWFNLSSDNL